MINGDCPNCGFWSNRGQVKCGTCNGTGDVSCPTTVTKSCGNCSGGIISTSKSCSSCGGDGTRSGTDYGTKYYAYYKYVSKLTATYTNNGGCSYSGNWSYGWKSSHSSCTRTTFSKSGSGSTKSSVSSVSLAGEKANYVTYNVTVRVKSGFEDVFKRTSQTKTLKADYSSAHYETYTQW
ncbi:MAG: hypothetical protein J6C13_00190, partial [Clostridia bacterium]|nr:hypothetical protein [Clostridia bacterium]